MLLGMCAVAQQAPLCAQAPAQQKAGVKRHAARPLVTGTDGSVTGTAKFQGNATTIAAPAGEIIGLAREPNCSLTFATGSYSTTAGSNDALAGSATDNYELVLHSEAGLTTTPDVFASGCIPPTTGLGSEPEVFVGTTTSGINVFAGIAYDPIAGSNGLYIVTDPLSKGIYVPTGAFSTDYSLNVFGFSTASVLMTADLNKDGNGDLIVANSVLTTSGSVSVLLGNADGTFQTAVSYPTAGSGTIAAVIDDVNGDGKMDIITVSSNLGSAGFEVQQISVLLGNGDGTFQSAQSFAVPAQVGYTNEYSTPIMNIITADLRGDGKKDIVCSNGQIFLGNGNGTFAATALQGFPYLVDNVSSNGPYLASGDINKDGKMDVVVDTANAINVYFGKGDGTFSEDASYDTIANNGEVTLSDLDGDGALDIYTGLANGGVYVGDGSEFGLSYALMGYGDGTFSGAPSTDSGGVYGAYTGTNLGDVNGDGLPDLITLGTYTNNVVSSTFTVLLGSKQGIFHPASTINIPASSVLNGSTISGTNLSILTYALGDLNGDGNADLAFITYGLPSSFSGLIYWTALSNGDGTFATPVPHPMPQLAPAGDNDSSTQTIEGMQLAPLTKGGKVAMLFSFYENIFTTQNVYLQGFMVLPGNGDGTFGTPVIDYTSNSSTHALISPPQVVSIADLNNDGKADLVTIAAPLIYNAAGNNYLPVYTGGGGQENELQVYLGNGDGTFAAPSTVKPIASMKAPQFPSANSPCVLADFNKDGKLDLACSGADANGQAELAISLGNGDGTFAAPTILDLTGGVVSTQGGIEGGIVAADFNGDGEVDLGLLVFNSYNGILYGNGDGTFTSVNTGSGIVPKDLINIGVGQNAVAVDLNGDGKPDILAGSVSLLNTYGSTVTTVAGTTTGLAASAPASTVGASVTLTATVTGAVGSTGTPTGAVTFYDGTTSLGTGPLAAGVATYATTALPIGSASITAVYGGDANFSGSTSSAVTVVVSAAAPIGTSTALTTSATTAVSGTSVTFTAVVTQASGTAIPEGTVTFLDGTTTLGTGTLNGTGAATYSTSALAVGSHTITASYGGATGFSSSTSSSVSVTIDAAVTPSYALSLSPSSGSVAAGSGTSTTISVTPAGGFNQAVNLACSGAPANTMCSVSPGSVTPNGSAAATATLTIQTDVMMASGTQTSLPGKIRGSGGSARLVLLSGAALLGCTLLGRRRRSWWYVQVGLMLTLIAAAAVTGCGGSVVPANATQPGTYTLTVTGTSGASTETATYSLTVH
jgi:hypothetical protein